MFRVLGQWFSVGFRGVVGGPMIQEGPSRSPLIVIESVYVFWGWSLRLSRVQGLGSEVSSEP